MDNELGALSETVDQIGFWVSEQTAEKQAFLYGAICYRIAMVMRNEAERKLREQK